MLLLAGCSVASRLERRQSRAIASYVPRESVSMSQEKSRPVVELKRDSATFFLAPAEKDENGEWIMTDNIEEIVVVAKSRTIAERNGKVSIDFVITLPKELQGNCQSVCVIPYLHQRDGIKPLQELSIRGGLFSRVQDRNYWQFSQYVRVFRPNMIEEQRAFERFVKYPYPDGVRLDSIVEGREAVSYYYTQDVPTEGEGKKMLVTLHGRVVALDGSYYRLPVKDTLEYNISSMLTFVDTTTRYVTRVIEKYAVVQDKNYLSFRVNDTRIRDDMGDNRSQLLRIEGLMNELTNQQEFHVDSIILTASASPEGRHSLNERLACGRAHSLKRWIAERFGHGVDSLIRVQWTAEDWPELARLIEADTLLTDKEAVLSLIGSVNEPDRREAALRNKFPRQYKYMRENLYPQLRAVNFKYDLRRRGMIKDTIHTTEPDMRYAEGVRLLQERKYHEALRILEEYDDQNTAVALLSVGKDERAYGILRKLPATAATEYLSAIACSRLGETERGREHFVNACNLNENLEYRGRLDPEIGNLLTDN